MLEKEIAEVSSRFTVCFLPKLFWVIRAVYYSGSNLTTSNLPHYHLLKSFESRHFLLTIDVVKICSTSQISRCFSSHSVISLNAYLQNVSNFDLLVRTWKFIAKFCNCVSIKNYLKVDIHSGSSTLKFLILMIFLIYFYLWFFSFEKCVI